MEPGRSKGRLEELIAATGLPLAALTPLAGLELMLRSYCDEPSSGALTCSWGVVTRYGDEEFGFNITREFNDPLDKSLRVAYLSLIFKIGPHSVAGDFPGWIKWVTSPENDLAAVRSDIETTPPFEVWGQSLAKGVALWYGDSESWFTDLFDCWGVRDPSRPVVSMSEKEWLRSDDVALMLRWFRQQWRGEENDLDRLLHRYCLACCRGIWRLLPRGDSRAGVEVAERFLEGLATRDEFDRAEYVAEGAAFMFDFELDPESISRWCDEVSQIPPEELAAMIHTPLPGDDLSPRGLLQHAAYFADIAMCYPTIAPKESIERFRLFLPASLLWEVVGNPFSTSSGGVL
jgi:hypothetical protein